MGCGSCHSEEYCGFSSGHPLCQKCTICPPGFFMVAQCSVHADRICQVSTSVVSIGMGSGFKGWGPSKRLIGGCRTETSAWR